MNSVRHAYAVLKGRRMGDPNQANEFLQGMHPAERSARNRDEQKIKVRLKKRRRGLGDHPRRVALGGR